MEYLEKVRSQLLSLRQIARAPHSPGEIVWLISLTIEAKSRLSFGFPPGGPAQYSPKGSFLSEALDFTDSVRASKFQRFELVGELQQEQVFTLLSHGETPENEFY